MKNTIKTLAIVAMLAVCFCANASELNTPSCMGSARETAVVDSDYQYIQKITYYRFGRFSNAVGKAALYSKGDNLYVLNNGSYYVVSTSNKDGYRYMFYDNGGAAYFNY